jgi:hypothetical protein
MSISLSNELLTLSATPTLDTVTAYAAGDLIGGKLTLSNVVEKAGAALVVDSIWLTDLAKQSADIDVIFFNADPTGTTFTDNAAFDPADADIDKIIGFQQITSYAAFNDSSFGRGEAARPLPFISAETSIYAALVARAAYTAASAADLVLHAALWRA